MSTSAFGPDDAGNNRPIGGMDRQAARAEANANQVPGVYPQPSNVPPGNELRQYVRYLITRPLMAIPVLADGGPDVNRVMEGVSVDLSAGGIGFEIGPCRPLPTRTLVVGLEVDDGSMAFCSVHVRHATQAGIGQRLGVQFYSPEQDLLRVERLTPAFSQKSYNFVLQLSDEALLRWGSLGVVRPMVLDWVQVCFQCQSLPTFRKGCPQCGSAHVATQRLVHHYACAHVGFAKDYEGSHSLQCPKCRTKNLVVGTDFEYLDGPFRCLDCQWSGTELELIAQCLRCRVRFPARRAVEKEIVGYHVRRLDPLAFVPAS